MEIWYFFFPNLYYFVPRFIICLYFWFLLNGSVLNLALKLVVLHVELENVNHGVLEVSETQILFHCISLKKLAYSHVNYNIVCASYPEIPGGGESIPPPNPPTYIRQK